MSLHSTKIQAQRCHRCGAPILTGWAEGLYARVDPISANKAGIVTAILNSRDLYAICSGQLVLRDCDRMRIRGPTLVAHCCGQQLPPQHRVISAAIPVQPKSDDEEILF